MKRIVSFLLDLLYVLAGIPRGMVERNTQFASATY